MRHTPRCGASRQQACVVAEDPRHSDGWKPAFMGRPFAANPHPQHTKRNLAAANVLSRCDDSVRSERRQSGTVGFFNNVHATLVFGQRLRSMSGCTAKAFEADQICLCLQSPPGLFECTPQVSFIQLLVYWSGRNLTAISAKCLQADTTTPSRSLKHFPTAVELAARRRTAPHVRSRPASGEGTRLSHMSRQYPA